MNADSRADDGRSASPGDVARSPGQGANPTILIAGVGNIFLGDDAFGVELIARLRGRELAPGVRIEDFGIRGIDLTYALLDKIDAVILLDAVQRGSTPGTLYVIEPDRHDAAAAPDAAAAMAPMPLLAAHDLDPATVLRLVRSMGGECGRVLLVGCEPESFGTEDEQDGRMGLSAPVAAAVERAIDVVVELAGTLAAATGAQTTRTSRIESQHRPERSFPGELLHR